MSIVRRTIDRSNPYKLIAFVGPTAVGKNTISDRVRAEIPGIDKLISTTTRPMREGEKEGVNYYYVSQERFDEMINEEAFIEWALVHDNGQRSGKTWEELKRPREHIRALAFDINFEGAFNLKKLFGDQVLTLFIAPPSFKVLEERFRFRSNDEDVLAIRLERAKKEMEYAPQFDHTIVNDDLDKAVGETKSIIQEFLDKV